MEDKKLDFKKVKKYLLKKGISISDKNDAEVLEIYKIETEESAKRGQEKRVKKLIESGKYKQDDNNGKTLVCRVCGSNFLYDRRLSSHKNGCCSYECYHKTGESDLKRKKSFLQKRGYEVENISEEEINKKHSQFLSENYSDSQKKRVDTIKNKGEEEFSRMTKLGNLNKKKKFLVDNDIASSEAVEEMELFKIDFLYKKFFNKISQHGEKIKNSIINKNGYLKILSVRESTDKKILKIIEEQGFDIENISPEHFQEERKKFIKEYLKNRSVIEWKRSHFKDEDNIEDLTEDEVNKKFSEYMSNRNSLIDNVHNGYKHTKKGYYKFMNIDKEMFFRSSWEEFVFKKIDDLIKEQFIIDVGVPDRLEYFHEFKRHYYPDVYYTKKDGTQIICEIKPKSKLKETINASKISVAKEKYGDKFLVLTENEIFSENFDNILLNQ